MAICQISYDTLRGDGSLAYAETRTTALRVVATESGFSHYNYSIGT